MKYRVVFTKKALKSLLILSRGTRLRIINKLNILANNPYCGPNIKALAGMKNAYRLRVGNYRVIYVLTDEKLVITIVKIAHRREVYK